MEKEIKPVALLKDTILVVDDDVDLASNMKDILEVEGYNVTVANNGEQARKMCLNGSVSLVIADIKLPDLSGVEFTGQIESICPDTEVIIVTGYASIDSAIAAVKLRNVIAYLTKPLDMRNLLVLVKQVKDRQRAERAARESELLFQLLAENVLDVIWTADLNLKMTYVSPSVEQQLGYTQSEAMALSLHDIVPKDSLGVFAKTIKNWQSGKPETENGNYYFAESENFKKDGTKIWTESRIRFMPAAADRAAYLLGVTRDVTQRKKSIEDLKHSQSRLAEAEKIGRLGHWDLDVRTNELIWSDEVYRIFGLISSQVNTTYDEFLKHVHPEDRNHVAKAVKDSLYKRKPYSIDHRVTLPDGTVRYVHEQGEVTYDAKNKPIRMFGTVNDVTERIQIEEELRFLSSRLVQIQEEERQNIARELHDQVGQVLTVLKLTLDRAVPLCSPEVKKQLKAGAGNISELISIVRNMSLNLRPAMLDDLGLLPTLFWHFDRFTSQTGIKVDFKHGQLEHPLPPEINITAYRIVQEALTNAARYAGVDRISVRIWSNKKSLSIQVEDNGKGFDPEAIDPRVSSGLHGMRERVRLLGGRVSVDSSPGGGTVLTAELPVPEEKDKVIDLDRNRRRPRRS